MQFNKIYCYYFIIYFLSSLIHGMELKTITNKKPQPDCSICCSLLHNNQNDVITLACHKAHSFHLDCLYKWKQKGDSCPICRGPFKQPAAPDELQFSSVECKKKKTNCNFIALQTFFACIGLGCHLRH